MTSASCAVRIDPRDDDVLPFSSLAGVALMLALSMPLQPATLRAQTTSAAPCVTTFSPPTLVRDLEPMTLFYRGTFAAAGKTMAVTSTLSVTSHPAGGWAVVERAELPRGLAVDSARLEARSLVPRERTIQQGPLAIALAFADDKATGTITVDGQARPIAARLCGSLFGDGAGAFLAIGRLPLASGFSTTLRHLDVQRAAEALRQLAVLGSEQVSVPAGTFETWKVQVTEEGNANQTMIWIDKTSLLPVKFSASQGPVAIARELARTGAVAR